MTDQPKFDYPFRLDATGHAVTVEQDSVEEIVASVIHLLKTTVGSRTELPTFGVPEQLFREGGVSLSAINAAIRAWDSRALVALSASQIQDLTQRVILQIQGSTSAD